DMLTFIEKAEAAFVEKKAKELEEHIKSGKFTLTDYYDQLVQLKGMGSMEDIMSMIPGASPAVMKDAQFDEKALAHTEAIILSMTPYERENPNCLNHSRKRRIAAGSGVKVEEINKLIKSYDMMCKMMRQFTGPGAKKKMKRMSRGGGFPGMGGFGGMGGFPGF
ncbi:MAG: signal recognition particle protein, partial [Oscillospiraceae bacterium]|nr:signal recognition particle protein [Oscillospiraceae bacterium]